MSTPTFENSWMISFELIRDVTYGQWDLITEKPFDSFWLAFQHAIHSCKDSLPLSKRIPGQKNRIHDATGMHAQLVYALVHKSRMWYGSSMHTRAQLDHAWSCFYPCGPASAPRHWPDNNACICILHCTSDYAHVWAMSILTYITLCSQSMVWQTAVEREREKKITML